MSLATPSKIKELCRQYNIKPQKRWGQNFLIDNNVAQKVVRLAQLSKNDQVVEVGGGFGALSDLIAPLVKKLIIYEIDKKLVAVLKEVLAQHKNIEIRQGDILKVEDAELPGDFKIVANLPYHITSYFLRRFLERKNYPQEILLIVQKELAERVVAKDGKTSLLSLAVEFYSQAQIIGNISKNCFWPRPQVDSAILSLNRIQKSFNQRLNKQEENFFFKVIKAAFSAKRRQIHNNLSTGLKVPKEKIKNSLLESKIDFLSRAENLGIQDFLVLTKKLKNVIEN